MAEIVMEIVQQAVETVPHVLVEAVVAAVAQAVQAVGAIAAME